MKSGLCASVQAIKDIDSFNGRLSILLTSDEEGEAKYGTKIVLDGVKKIESFYQIMQLLQSQLLKKSLEMQLR